MDFQQWMLRLKREIRDLKTAQTRPSLMKFYEARVTIPQNITKGFHHWTIQYEESTNQTEPIAFECDFVFVLEFYDQSTNTQKIVYDCPYDGSFGGLSIYIYSTRPIVAITKD